MRLLVATFTFGAILALPIFSLASASSPFSHSVAHGDAVEPERPNPVDCDSAEPQNDESCNQCIDRCKRDCYEDTSTGNDYYRCADQCPGFCGCP